MKTVTHMGFRMKTISHHQGLLAGMRVLDLADETGSFCSRILADLGADVIKIEKPGGDASRNIGPFRQDPEQGGNISLSFAYHNANKSGITLNLEHPCGRKVFLDLIRKSAAVVETAPPGYYDGLGIGYEAVRLERKSLIWASITGFGQNGPRQDFKSCDLVAAALGGQMFVCGSPSAPPLKLFGEQSFFAASLFAATGILLALRKSRATGLGDCIDISLQEAVVSTLEHVMLRYFHRGIVAQRREDRHWNDLFCILPCRDGFMQITPFLQWETLVALLDQEGMAGDLTSEAWSNESYRLENRECAIAVIRKWTATHTVDELFELGQLLRLPWAPVVSPRQVPESPQLKARDFFPESSSPGLPYKFSSVPLPAPAPAPQPGQDNEEIYVRDLGLSREYLASLSTMGVV
jgi:crotonobetainyl-CoA:carnitine CoA-transferase CaiB-like acyl-CoA transferase